ncbi:OsmC family protein [Neisseria leonii]|uniref:OsmC family protein n=1 Tax=Neisseria leonii TaxID=2995413 RepID=A0A9X4E2R9_9NEIS|nr:OsmC family protein [Neisseria sp. 51.81]MDD9328383.1 OsmC family protein [Neisseria sp. 51.81]
MQVNSRWIDGLCFEGRTADGHTVVMEGAAAEGDRRGPSPMEMLLLGVAGCAGIDVVMIAQKQRQQVSDCRATVTAKRADTVPRVFTEIHIHFQVCGRDLNPAAVEKAVGLSAEKYCSASLMLGKAAKITHSFEILED